MTEQLCSMLPSQMRCIENGFDNDAIFYGDSAEDGNNIQLDEDEQQEDSDDDNDAPPQDAGQSVSVYRACEASSSSTRLNSKSSPDITKSLPLKRKQGHNKEKYYKDILTSYAEKEHKKKMEIYHKKLEILELKRRKLEKEIENKTAECSTQTGSFSENVPNNSRLWQPF